MNKYIKYALILLALYLIYKRMTRNLSMINPIDGELLITSKFGPRNISVPGASTYHNGVDLRAAIGTPIKAPSDGVVDAVWEEPKGGKQIRLKLSNGYYTGFAHLQKSAVKSGDLVKQGQIVAYSGDTGIGSAHLHYTVRNSKKELVNPIKVLKNYKFKSTA